MRTDSGVTVAQIGDFDEVIDVRSPAEFALDHVPGAVNHPVLDDEERARVGTLYKQVSPFDARKLGAALVSRNIARHLESAFAARPATWRPLVYCWRGGKRSGAMAHVLSEVGWRAAVLAGGYQAYRRAVLAELESLPANFDFRVVCGPTGSGKSALLEALAAQGAQVLDLEGLARHRGSVLGDLPGDPQPSQKMFDSLVWQALRGLKASQPVYVEAESRKIGSVQLLTPLLERMRASRCLRVEPTLAERVKFLVREYRHLIEQPELLKHKLAQLSDLQPREVMAHWMDCIASSHWEELVADLLERHYDPLYRRSLGRNYPASGDAAVIRPGTLEPEGLHASAARVLASSSIDSVRGELVEP